MKRIIRAIRVRALRLFGWLQRLDPKRIRLLSMGHSGSNSLALFESIPADLRDRLDVRMVPSGPRGGLFATLGYVADLARSSVVISTHGYSKWNARQRNLELWHGFPLKGMNLMDASEVRAGKARRSWKSVDLVASYSPLYSSLMSACMGVDAGHFALTGLPRNDFLWGEDGEALLDEVLGSPTGDRRVVFYMPTFRRGFRGRIDGGKSTANVFGFARFDGARFARFLEEHGIRFVAKLHPFEERVFLAEGRNCGQDGVELLTDRALEERDLELYRILARADCLVTDYSSVYFDLLLRDIPLIFSPVDLEEYRASRGFLMEPYEFWAPGPKALDQDGLERELLRSLSDRQYYAEARHVVRDIVHSHIDRGSAERVWNLVRELLGDDKASNKESAI